MKDFDNWNKHKKIVDNKKHGDSFYIRDGELWWCSVGLNIGVEIDGKNEIYERPVFILKNHNKDIVSILPVTTKVKDTYYQYNFEYKSKHQSVVLTQVKAIDTKRLSRKIGVLPKNLRKEILEKFVSLYKYESPHLGAFSEPCGLNNLSINNSNNKSSVKLNVPYHSQFLEVEDYYWNIRSCSGACVAMSLEYLIGKKINILEYMKEAERAGGYSKLNGANHDYIISFFERNGLKSWRYKNPENKDTLSDINLLVEELEKGNSVIVSVNKFILEQKKFHLILLIGFEKDEIGNVTHFYYHEPEATIISIDDDKAVGGANREVDIENFKLAWRGKAIFVSR